MHRYTAIHVDDDPRSIALFKELAAGVPQLELTASFTNADEALSYLNRVNTDLLFSDIEMPGKNGFDLVGQLEGRHVDVIFVTAHPGYAVSAFEACAIDYLVKPIQQSRLLHTMDIYAQRRSRAQYDVKDQIKELFQHYIAPQSYPKRIFINLVGKLQVVILSDVLYFSASGGYTNVYFGSGEVLLASKILKVYVDSLVNHPDFVRIHRSHLVNKNYVSTLNRNTSRFSVTMTNGDMLEVSHNKKDEIFDLLMK